MEIKIVVNEEEFQSIVTRFVRTRGLTKIEAIAEANKGYINGKSVLA